MKRWTTLCGSAVLLMLAAGCGGEKQTATFEWREFPPLPARPVIVYIGTSETVTNLVSKGEVLENLAKHGWAFKGTSGDTIVMEGNQQAPKFFVRME